MAGGIFYGLVYLLDFQEIDTTKKLDAKTLFDLVKLSFGVVAGAGALVTYRRQRVDEAGAHRETTRLHTERFTAAVEQLGSDSPAVRLGGVHALAGLADDAPDDNLRQTCIDVLCAYLQLPFAPDPGDDPAHQDEHHRYLAFRKVRHTILRLIGDHYRRPKGTHRSWQGCDLDLTGVTIDGYMSFNGATFSDDVRVSFDGAMFSDGMVSFDGATFSGDARVSFSRATFSGGYVSFKRTAFSGGMVLFYGVRVLSRGVVIFDAAAFSGSEVDFDHAQFSGGHMSFDHAIFSGGEVSFERVMFRDGGAFFEHAQFSGSEVSFRDATFSGGEVSFNRAVFCGGNLFFNETTISAMVVRFHGATFSGGRVYFRDATGVVPDGLPTAPAPEGVILSSQR